MLQNDTPRRNLDDETPDSERNIMRLFFTAYLLLNDELFHAEIRVSLALRGGSTKNTVESHCVNLEITFLGESLTASSQHMKVACVL